ncbi:MAG: helix-turn-helix domain-containing protein, partial [Planctomycetota bacterium]
ALSVGGEEPPPIEGDLRAAVADFEQRAILRALERHQGNKSRAASDLGISRFALQRKLDKYGLVTDGPSEG